MWQIDGDTFGVFGPLRGRRLRVQEFNFLRHFFIGQFCDQSCVKLNQLPSTYRSGVQEMIWQGDLKQSYR